MASVGAPISFRKEEAREAEEEEAAAATMCCTSWTSRVAGLVRMSFVKAGECQLDSKLVVRMNVLVAIPPVARMPQRH